MEVSRWWTLITIGVNFLTIWILFRIFRKRGVRFREIIGFQKGKQNFSEIAMVVLIMLVTGMAGLWGFSYLVYGYMPVVNIQPLPLWAAITVVILLPATIVFAEIPLYTGYCSPALQEITDNRVFSVVYPLFFYALQHSFIPLIFDIRHIVAHFLTFIPLLIFIGIWYAKKKSLFPLLIGHGILDLFTGIQILIFSLNPALFELMRNHTVP